MILACHKNSNRWDGHYHPFFAVHRELDNGMCLVLHMCERRYIEIDPGHWAGGGCWEWHYRERDGTVLGKETVHA